jgi:poly(A) polymerase Pap1
LDISAPTSEFMKLARGWEAYQNEIMGIAVRHIKKSVPGLFWNRTPEKVK